MSQLTKAKEQLHSDPARFIASEIKEFMRTSPSGRLPFLNDLAMWAEPLVKFADSDDSIFTQYKTIIGADHLTPREMLAKAYDENSDDMPVRLSVISWILPIAEETRKSNRLETRVPSRLWSHTRWYGEKSNQQLGIHIAKLLAEMGYLAVAPSAQGHIKVYNNEKGPYSSWSERHIAFAAGQGTFGLSDGFITQRGIAHRCGSVVTSLELPPSPRIAEGPYSSCLFYQEVNCRACIDRCPAKAITENGHDKPKCQQYLRALGYSPVQLKDGYDNDKSVAGCGLCQTKVPCEFQDPTIKLIKKTNAEL